MAPIDFGLVKGATVEVSSSTGYRGAAGTASENSETVSSAVRVVGYISNKE
jgi:hypothetical protein